MNQGSALIVRVGLATLAMAVCASLPAAAGATQTPTEHSVGSRPETVSWGWFPLDKPPVLTIASGDTVRIEMLDEGVRVMKAMWTDSPANFSGEYYHVDNVHCEPLPNPLPILMLGGGGERRTLRVVAEHADWWNDVMRPVDQLQRKLDALKVHCEAIGRDYDSIRKTLAPRFYLHRTHSKALEMAGDKMTSDQPPIAGDPVAVTEQLMELVEMGFDFSVATFPQFQELDDMKLFVNEVMPHAAAFVHRWFRRADVHAPVDLHGVHRHQLDPLTTPGHLHRQCRLARGGGAHEHQVPVGGGHPPAEARPQAEATGIRRRCRGAAVTRTSSPSR